MVLMLRRVQATQRSLAPLELGAAQSIHQCKQRLPAHQVQQPIRGTLPCQSTPWASLVAQAVQQARHMPMVQ